ncbi:MAG TPA: ribokinase [Fimbriimonadaceae bacterium]|nr:ribokinase [Fimbriimonadaceae bacterium]
MSERIAVVGSANADLVMKCPRLPAVGETVTGGEFSVFPGGKGANQAVAAARLGGEVSFVGAVGRDAYGAMLRESLSTSGVDVAYLMESDEPTGTAVITVDAQGQNTIAVAPGANFALTAEHVSSALAAIDPTIVLVQLEISDEALYACAGRGRLILDPAPARNLDPDFLANVEIITPNENETLALTGIAPIDEVSVRRAADSLVQKGPKSALITLGAKGAYLSNGISFDAPTVTAVDTTAAGDALAGALACFVAGGDFLSTAIEKAVRAASLSTTKIGAQPSMPTLDELGL